VASNEKLLKWLIETPAVPEREEQRREIIREGLESSTGEVCTDRLGSMFGTKKGRAGR
jgi:putative aminopeptidase FrvX